MTNEQLLIKVNPGELSDPTKMSLTWEMLEYTESYMVA